MNIPEDRPEESAQFLLASPPSFSCTQAARAQPMAQDAFNRLLTCLLPDAETLCCEAPPQLRADDRIQVLDDSVSPWTNPMSATWTR